MTPRLSLPTRQAVHDSTRLPETLCVPPLLAQARRPQPERDAVQTLAMRLARGLREHRAGLGRAGLVQGLLQEFALSSQEGVALMCLAEALLRIPDPATRDALIRDKIGRGNWQAHLGHSESIFVNAASWGLLLTGKLVATHSGGHLEGALRRVLSRGGEPVIRKGLDLSMRLMGEQFVTGQTIAEALRHARPRQAQGFRYSYDMLGEAAMTAADAQRYFQAYADSIEAIGQEAAGLGPILGPGISIKLSALHPRYQRWQARRVHEELYPALLQLAERACALDIGLNIDAEESERLEISLDLLERLALEPTLRGWAGLGFVVQAYQKRCPAVVAQVIALARHSGRRLMVRLVKGAYWDSEIKRAQVEGQADYPVYTRKPHTDLSYLACAQALLAAPDAVFPQFATHNAHTVAAIVEMAGPANWATGQYEFQCLHGMGEPLYEQIVGGACGVQRPCRVYAPVGTHETLLAYLVRRLLENGANTSFVNRVANEEVPLEALIEDPVQTVERAAAAEGAVGLPHPAIALPVALYGSQRRNAAGLDLSDEGVIAGWEARWALGDAGSSVIEPLWQAPDASEGDMEAALRQAQAAAPHWAGIGAAARAQILERAAERFEARMQPWLELLAREAGKTVPNGVAEVREAVDFLRYYAQQIRHLQAEGPCEPLGPVLCISPWNFPLAIFTGQVAAALAAGNTVLAKPAEQTPAMARAAVQELWAAGVPREVLHLLCGPGETVGARLTADPRVQGVMFTGSTEVARLIQGTLAQRLGRHGQPVPLVAETGGQNAMIVDSSALLEQVTADVLSSGFDSAGQRCSALRLLCVQEDVAPALLAMIRGAMDELMVGEATRLSTDVGPVIDEPAQRAILDHIEHLRQEGCRIHQCTGAPGVGAGSTDVRGTGRFVMPTLIELSGLHQLTKEVFGPVVHVLRFERQALPEVVEAVRATGYGLTMGVHSRIDETIAAVVGASPAGNVYVNRNMVGAVVGVQPFGGEGLSGTGPKAGGPLALLRLMARHPADAARRLVQACGVAADGPLRETVPDGSADRGGGPTMGIDPALRSLVAWLQGAGRLDEARLAQQQGDLALSHDWRVLAGPTGERNVYAALPRESVLCVAETERGLIAQTAAALASGCQATWEASWQGLHERLPAPVRERIRLAADWRLSGVAFDAALVEGQDKPVRRLAMEIAAREGPIVSLTRTGLHDEPVPAERLVLERAVSINTAAAGGNASLMTIA